MVLEPGGQCSLNAVKSQHRSKKMANPSDHVVLDEEAACAAEECYAALEAEL